jgi:hypothetical protein
MIGFCGWVFGIYLVFLMLLGEFETSLSLATLSLRLEIRLLLYTAVNALSSTFLMILSYFYLKLLTFVSLKNLKSFGYSGNDTFFSILSLSLPKEEFGK